VIVPRAPELQAPPVGAPAPAILAPAAQSPAAPLLQITQEKPVSLAGNVLAAMAAGLLWVPFIWQNMFGAVVLSVAASNILFLRMLYKAWSGLPALERRIAPGEAVGKLFIPFYNLYWTWKAVPGFAVNYNQYIKKKSLPNRPQSVGLYIFFCLFYWYIPVLAFMFEKIELAEALELFDVIVLAPVAIGVMTGAIHQLMAQPPAKAVNNAEQSIR